MKSKNYFALYAFDEKVGIAARESHALKIAVALMLILFSAWTIIVAR